MRFVVTFFRNDSPDSNVYCFTFNSGIDFVDRIRKELDLPKLSIELIEPYAGDMGKIISFNISEQLARKSQLFKKNNYVEIGVKNKNLRYDEQKMMLNKYIFVDYEKTVDETTGEITSIYPVIKFDTMKLLNDWENAGFPIVFTIK